MLAGAQTLYRLLRPALFRLDPETAHRVTLAILAAIPPLAASSDAPELGTSVFGINFSNPVGLAAGMDKEGRAAAAWQTLGFGFAELGTVTPRPQPGNPRPRLWRLPAHRALVNSLGFPSRGMDAMAGRIARLRRNPAIRIRLGLNFGPNKDTPAEAVAADYAVLMERLGALADFVVVNVSSPNTPGLRNWQSAERMREIFSAMEARCASMPRRPPVLIKLAPDLDASALSSICAAAMELRLAGAVVCNTTLARAQLGVAAPSAGGLSGRPLLPLARRLIAQLHRQTAGRLPIIGVGGVMSAQDAFGHIAAGASLVELYTGLVYEGPGLAGRIKAGLARMLAERGFRSIGDAVGSAAKETAARKT